MMEEQVTVIIPVYQVVEWVARCVNSVKEQTYENLEIILVDDGSTDGSGELCDELGEHDDRIRVIHQSNCGLSAARNVGLAHASGRWVTFVDSDDWIHPEMIERLVSMTAPNIDMAVSGFARVANTVPHRPLQPEPVDVLTTSQVLTRYFGTDRTLLTIACGKLFRRDMLSGISFPEGRLHEDEATTYLLLARARRIALTHNEMYYYFSRPTSITGSGLSIRNHVDIVRAAEERLEFFQRHQNGKFEIAALVDLTRKLIQLHKAYLFAGDKDAARSVLARIRNAARRIPIGSRPQVALFARFYPVAPTLLGYLQRIRLKLLRASDQARPSF